MLNDGWSKQWENFIGLHSKPMEDDVDDGIVPWEGGYEAEVGEKEETTSSRAHTWGQLWSFLWIVEQVVRNWKTSKVAPPSVAQIGSIGLTKMLTMLELVKAPQKEVGMWMIQMKNFMMWKSQRLHKMELIKPQMKYMMNVLAKRSSKFLLVVALKGEVNFTRFTRMVSWLRHWWGLDMTIDVYYNLL